MNVSYDGTLEKLGLLAAVYLVITLIGTLVGQPWASAGSSTVGLVQTLGILLSLVIAAAIVFVTQGHDLDDLSR